MHITLHFLGAAPTERVGALIESLSCAAVDPAPEICVRGVGTFGQRVLYAKVAPDAAVKEFAAGFEPLLRRFELPTSPRPYVPHVTMARLRGTSDTVVRTWRRRWSALESEPFRAEGYVFRSEPQPNGPPSYVRLGPRHLSLIHI